LRTLCPPVYDQGALGSCTGNAIAGAFEYDQLAEKITDATPSRLFIYYNERVIEGTVDQDAGANIRDGLKSCAKQGACYESDWPYDISKFAQKPPRICYTDGVTHRISSYWHIPQTVSTLKAVLAGGRPFVFGITVYDSFESDVATSTGNIPMPDVNRENVLGGHALLCVGYDDRTGEFIFRNSWGVGWGNNGYGTIPYAYLLDTTLSGDFWTIKATH
jgi:C1A family cysteine protease